MRQADPAAAICGPGFAFPSYEKYRQFLVSCRNQGVECNYLAWHYTGWDPSQPEQGKWNLGKLRDFMAEFPAQKIREIHCDEWGAGPDKPGRLHPGRALVWFQYLENVYHVDRACRANWGREDDYLGGLVNAQGQPFPVYHAYRFYGATKGQTRVASEGNSKTLACLASRAADHCELLLGSIAKGTNRVVLELHGLEVRPYQAEASVLPATNLDRPLLRAELPAAHPVALERTDTGLRLAFDQVEENQAYRIVLRHAGPSSATER